MQHLFKNRIENFQKQFVEDCFKTISECVSTQRYSLLIGGNYAITMDKNANGDFVPFMYQIPFGEKDYNKIRACNRVELYSEDGYEDLKDIGHWADICLDMIMAQSAGCERYNSNRVDNTIPHQ